MIRDFLQSLLTLAIDMGFYMVIGLVLVGALNIFIKKQWIAKHLGGSGVWSIIKASIMGVPLPLCSCGVVPTGLYLRDKGASKASAMSFLISTPQTGADSIIATYGLMGPLFAWYRPMAAFVSGVVGGIGIKLFGNKVGSEEEKALDNNEEKKGIKERVVNSFKYAFGEFTQDIAVHFLLGLVIAAFIGVLIPAEFIASVGLGSGIVSMLIMIALGAPMYICSTSSIPIAVMLMAKGLSPGAAYVFLFMGPFTNAASLVMISKKFGKKNTVVYFVSAAISALGFGLLLDYIVGVYDVQFAFLSTSEAGMTYTTFQTIVASGFIALVLFYSLRQLANFIGKLSAGIKLKTAPENEYSVEGMDCKHCASGLEAAVRGQEGVENVLVDFDSKSLKVWGKISYDNLKKTVEAHGYSMR